MLLGLIIIIYQEKLTNFQLKNEFLAPNKRAGRNFSSKLISVQFLIRRAGREKSQKLIKESIANWFQKITLLILRVKKS